MPDRTVEVGERENADIEDLLYVFEHRAGTQFALPLLPVPEGKRDLLCTRPASLPEYLHQNLVAAWFERGIFHHLFPDGKEATHRIGDVRKEDPPEPGRPERDDPPFERPLLDPAALHVPAAHHHVGSLPDGPDKIRDQCRWVGEIGIDDLDDTAPSMLESLGNRLGESMVAFTHDKADIGIFIRTLCHNLDRPIS